MSDMLVQMHVFFVFFSCALECPSVPYTIRNNKVTRMNRRSSTLSTRYMMKLGSKIIWSVKTWKNLCSKQSDLTEHCRWFR